MLRRSLFVAGLFAFCALPTACHRDDRIAGSGKSKTETRTLDTFDRILVEGAATIDVTIGKPRPVTVTADDNILPVLKTTVSDGLLLIKPEVPIEPDTPIVVKIQTAALSEIACRGAADMHLRGIDNEKLTITIDGAGKVHAKGRTKELVADARGAGLLSLADLEAQTAHVSISGAGSAAVNAVKKLVASIVGAGQIEYVGDPEVE